VTSPDYDAPPLDSATECEADIQAGAERADLNRHTQQQSWDTDAVMAYRVSLEALGFTPEQIADVLRKDCGYSVGLINFRTRQAS